VRNPKSGSGCDARRPWPNLGRWPDRLADE
jgi:hypothetical protein